MSQEQQALLEVMQEVYSQGEKHDADLAALLTLITEKMTMVVKQE